MRRPEDILLLVAHPFGPLKLSLATWIKHGPGPRTLLEPIQAWDRRTGDELPLDVVPRPFRNDWESIRMIVDGEVADPWNRNLGQLQECLRQHCPWDRAWLFWTALRSLVRLGERWRKSDRGPVS